MPKMVPNILLNVQHNSQLPLKKRVEMQDGNTKLRRRWSSVSVGRSLEADRISNLDFPLKQHTTALSNFTQSTIEIH